MNNKYTDETDSNELTFTEKNNKAINECIDKIKAIPFQTKWFKDLYLFLDGCRNYTCGVNGFYQDYEEALFGLKLESYILNKFSDNEKETAVKLFYRDIYQCKASLEDILAMCDFDRYAIKISRNSETGEMKLSNINNKECDFTFKIENVLGTKVPIMREISIKYKLPYSGNYNFKTYYLDSSN